MKKTILFTVVLFLSINSVFSNDRKNSFERAIDSILLAKPITYKGINDYMRPFRSDTVMLKKMLPVFKETNYLHGKTYAENLLGIRFRNYSQYKKAIKMHNQALETAKEANSIEFRVFSLNMLGVDYRKMDANRTALDYNQEALALAETVKSPSLGLRRSIAVSHNSMGNIYLLLKQYDLAIKQFEQSQTIERSINNKLGLAINYQNIGYAKDALGKTKEALGYYQKSLSINNEMNNKLGKVICNSSIAEIYIKQGKLKEALRLIKKNIPEAKMMGRKDYLSFEYLNLGWVQTKLGRYEDAKNNIEEGLTLAEKYNLIKAKSTAYTYLSEYYQSNNKYDKALKYYKLAEEYDEKVSNERNIQYVNDLIIKYDSERKNNQIKDLAKQNEIVQLKLAKNRNLWIIILSLFTLLGTILYFFYRNQRLRDEKMIIRLEQDAMRSQMNPHFIFNSLNAIKLYIINNDTKKAVYYLNKFSKLIRKILGATREKEITLDKEIETLELYLDIENIRFSNEIKSSITIDEQLDIETIRIPSLILQPFVENAIWHGLSSKDGEKKLDICFDKIGKKYLDVTIVDNGIGREESARIKSRKIHKRESIGIKLTEERLANFCKDFKNNCSLNLIDLYNEKKQAIGTKVVLRIPLK